MKREPIIEQKQASIILVENPLSVNDLLPGYRYQIEDYQGSKEAESMYTGLIEFIDTNLPLAVEDKTTANGEYIEGFKKAMALTRLWIDSIYYKGE